MSPIPAFGAKFTTKACRLGNIANTRAPVIAGTHLLAAAGRIPNTENIGLELAGVEVTQRGFVKVDERLETTAPGRLAIGEVAGTPAFNHVSVDDFRVVHDSLTGELWRLLRST